MADELAGVGFKIADEIAARVGIQSNSDYRIRSGILFVLMQAAAEGHTYLPEPVLLNRTGDLLRVEIPHIEKFIMDLCIDKKLIVKEKDGVRNVYAAQYYYLELNVAAMLHDLNVNCEISTDKISERLEKIEEIAHIELDEMQRMAVIEAVKNGLLVITGGPGTGKTTTINAMIKFFETEGLEIRLAAPTGRAAKRMTEATGYEAQTIHRLLELSYVPDDDDGLSLIHICVAYILDEPSIGLHQRDNDKLLRTLNNLKELGNTLIVVEHDEDTMYAADHVIDIGPGAGEHGGHVAVSYTHLDVYKRQPPKCPLRRCRFG